MNNLQQIIVKKKLVLIDIDGSMSLTILSKIRVK